ncbi:MAG: PTS sugar transporter subunit IIA, partial [Proteobacteria bacterium]|nr:PTS sugar transporter subunit IIA [Pseudomonadota bacterium]
MTALFTLSPEAVDTIDADSKQAILARLADRFAAVYGLDPVLVLERIEEREKLGSTGFGRGVAIPHARLPDLSRPVAVFFRLDSPVAFDAADGMPVDM